MCKVKHTDGISSGRGSPQRNHNVMLNEAIFQFVQLVPRNGSARQAADIVAKSKSTFCQFFSYKFRVAGAIVPCNMACMQWLVQLVS